MGSLLKEALKCLCGENRWSYAVFWKIGCQNPTLLIWEDYHYQPTQKSSLADIHGIDSTELLLKEWEGLWGPCESRFSQHGSHSEDKICSLINRMMIHNNVYVVGEGIVGRVAFTGNHQWVLQGNCISQDYPSEMLSEVHHQFSAGMQTVAAIPVLPHGVVQLGSTQAIVENMGFVNDIKSLFAQLGDAPPSLSSDYLTEMNICQKIGPSSSLAIPIPSDSAKQSCSEVARFTPFVSARCNQEVSTSHASGLLTQVNNSLVTHTQNCMTNASALRTTPCLSSTMVTPASNHTKMKRRSVIKTDLLLKGQLETGAVGAQVIMSSSAAQLRQPPSPCNANSRFSQQLVQSALSWTNPNFMDQQNLSSVGLEEPFNSILLPSNYTNTSQLKFDTHTVSNSSKDSVIVSLISGHQPPNGSNDLQTLTSISRPISCGSVENTSACLPLKGLQVSSNTDVVHKSNSCGLSSNSSVRQGVPERSSTNENLTRVGLAEGKQVTESVLFQELNRPGAHIDHHTSMCVRMPDLHHVSDLKHDMKTSWPQNVICNDACNQTPSGDNLFDILGPDCKRKQLYGAWNSSFNHGTDVTVSNLTTDASTSITQADGSHERYAVDDGISESGIFNERGDNLLDAVVSKAHPGGEQNWSDDMSCWTMLTKGSSSGPRTGHVNVSDEKQANFFGFLPPPAVSQITGSSSLISGCSKDTFGETSQINAMYGSQISLLGEVGQAMKGENSISTAHSKKPDEPGKSNRKRLRPGENPRPRPKDRQMIQDRVKELREIVPNSAKCSIDALLERTIKHMLFLQSVTKHAEKLKYTGESKIINRAGDFFLKDNFEGGATWAFEVGSQSMVCPIIVEDLNPPRQMLVEMLCEEQGFFLEIADIIRGLGLTILKGVMEARNDKVWVCFTVEANRDVTRMEIFLSLVHLLEQFMKKNASTSKGTYDGDLMAHNSTHQAPLPVVGLAANLN